MYKTKITSQGTISLPAALRRKYNLKQGDELSIEDSGKLVISKVPDFSTLREKNRVFTKKSLTVKSGDGFLSHVSEKYGK